MDPCSGRHSCINRKNANVTTGILFSVTQAWHPGFVLNYLDDGCPFSDGYSSGINYRVLVENRAFPIYATKCEAWLVYPGTVSLDREAIDQALWSIALINGGDRKPKIYEWWLLISTIKRLHYNDYSIGDISSWRPSHGQLHGAAVYTSDAWAVHFRCKCKVIHLNWVVLITQGSTAEFPEM